MTGPGHHPAEGLALLAALPTAVLVCDGGGLCVFVNPRWTEITGLTAAESLGSGWLRPFPPEERDRIRTQWLKPAAENRDLTEDVRCIHPDGAQYWLRVLLAATPGSAGVARGWVATAIDVTLERKRAEAVRAWESRLKENEERFRTLADQAPALIWMSGPDGGVNYVNTRWLQFTGRTLQEELASDPEERVHPADAEGRRTAYLEAFARPAAFTVDYRLRRQDGEYRWLADHGAPRYLGDGSFAGFVGVCHDITDSRLAREVLQAKVSLLTESTRQIPTAPLGDLPGGPPAAREIRIRQAPAPSAGPRILVVDDNSVNQKVAARMLARLGCQVDVAAHGREALDLVRHSGYELVFMDCMMPEMDGYEATAAIRQLPAPARDTPIVAMTANAMQGDRERCLAAGMDDYLSKPVQPEQLAAALERWTSRRRIDAPTGPSEGSAAGPAAEPAVDPSVIEGFRQLQEPGGTDIVSELIDLFLEDLPLRRQAILDALSSGDVARVRAAALALKSSAIYIGARELARVCHGLETRAHAADLPGAGRVAAELEAEARRVVAVLRTFRVPVR